MAARQPTSTFNETVRTAHRHDLTPAELAAATIHWAACWKVSRSWATLVSACGRAARIRGWLAAALIL